MSLEGALRTFHGRDWEADVRSLDRQIARRNRASADLALTPPSIITGDPFSLTPARCVLVLGINPGWRNGRVAELDADPAHCAWIEGFDAYRSHRSRYFEEGPGPVGRSKKGDPRYSAHFSKLGDFIARAIRIKECEWEAGPTARRLFRERAAIFDLIPYWSTDTSKVDFNRIDPGHQPCIRDWHGVIDAFVAEKRPVAIFVNNSGNRSLVSSMLRTNLRPVEGTQLYIGTCDDAAATPIFAHPFVSRWYGAVADRIVQFDEAVDRFNRPMRFETLGLQSPQAYRRCRT